MSQQLEYDEDLARGLRRARLARGIGFREAGRLLEIDQSSVYRIEIGEIDPTMNTLRKMTALYRANLNISVDGVMLTWMEGDGPG